MYRPLLIAAVIGLASCTTPEERCVAEASAGLSDIDAQIAEAELNLARGYRTLDPVIDTVSANFCSQSGNFTLCLGGDRELEGRRVAIDVASERGRLEALQNQRARMVERMEREIAACRGF